MSVNEGAIVSRPGYVDLLLCRTHLSSISDTLYSRHDLEYLIRDALVELTCI